MTSVSEAIGDLVALGEKLTRTKGHGDAIRLEIQRTALLLYKAARTDQERADLSRPHCNMVRFGGNGELEKAPVVILRQGSDGSLVVRFAGAADGTKHRFVTQAGRFVEKTSAKLPLRYQRWLSDVPSEYLTESTN